MSQVVQLVVDSESCIGSGVCEMLEEQVFLIDEDTFIASVIEGARLPADRAAVVIDRCPASAISIAEPVVVDSESNKISENDVPSAD